MATLDVTDLTVVKGDSPILHGVTFSVADGELLAIVGPSGSGKTTLLRAVAGLDDLAGGRIEVGGRSLAGVDVAYRNVAMVFQTNVLFPFLDVGHNIAFPLEMQRAARADIERRVQAEGRALHITELMDRDPHELSAGHQQLVQIAKAMVRSPELFLMDEPLARLDPARRVPMRGELRMIQRGYGVTTLYVTNDPVEAMSMGDRIAVLVDGRIVQLASPVDVYAAPVSSLVAELTGELGLLTVGLVRGEPDGFWLEHRAFRVRVWAPRLAEYVGLDVVMGVRPEHFALDPAGDIEVEVVRVDPHGPHDMLVGSIDGDRIQVRSRAGEVRAGERVRLRLRGGHVFDPVDGVTVATWS